MANLSQPHDIFISYAREDSAAVRRLVEALRSRGVRVWFDETSIEAGDVWMAKIQGAIESCRHFVACFSESYARKARSVMQAELRIAVAEFQRRQPDSGWFLPVRIEPNASLPSTAIGLDLRAIHHVDLFGEHWDEAVARLVRRIRPSTGAVLAPRYKVGDVSAEVYMDLLGGADRGHTWSEVTFAYEHIPTPIAPELEARRAVVVQEEERVAKEHQREFFNGPCVRLHRARPNIGSADPGVEEKMPEFSLRPTCWHDYAISNKQLDTLITAPDGSRRAIRDVLADESRLVTSRRVDWVPFSNILTCSVVLLTADMHTLIGLRTDRVDNHAGVWASSYAENIHRLKDEPSDPSDFWSTPHWELGTKGRVGFDYRPASCPNPFSAVRRGIFEEVSMDLVQEISRDDITLLHLAWCLTSFNPHLYFLVRTRRSIEDVKAMTRGSRAPDAWEATLFPVPFLPEGELKRRLLFDNWADISKGAIMRALVEVHGFAKVAAGLREA